MSSPLPSSSLDSPVPATPSSAHTPLAYLASPEVGNSDDPMPSMIPAGDRYASQQTLSNLDGLGGNLAGRSLPPGAGYAGTSPTLVAPNGVLSEEPENYASVVSSMMGGQVASPTVASRGPLPTPVREVSAAVKTTAPLMSPPLPALPTSPLPTPPNSISPPSITAFLPPAAVNYSTLPPSPALLPTPPVSPPTVPSAPAQPPPAPLPSPGAPSIVSNNSPVTLPPFAPPSSTSATITASRVPRSHAISQSLSVPSPTLPLTIAPPRRASDSMDYFSGPGLEGLYPSPGLGMEGPYPSLAPTISRGRTYEGGSKIERTLSNGTGLGPREDSFELAAIGAGVGGGQRTSMVGIGRHSLLRSTSGGAGTLLMGALPSTTPSPPTATAVLPPHLVQQPEVCVECMMRDRDMIGIEVLGEGAWERESDWEWEEALRWEREEELKGGGESEEGGRKGGSRESGEGRRRLGKGQPLTVASLKLWTSMNPPASAHRWRTLQAFLAMQIHLLELERHAREANLAERDRRSTDVRSSPSSIGRSRASTLLPNGLVVENINVDKDEKTARARAKSRSRADEGKRSTSSFFPSPSTLSPVKSTIKDYDSPPNSVRSYGFGDQPWLTNQARRFSSPALKETSPTSPTPSSSSRIFKFGFTKSTTDLRSTQVTPTSLRSLSPGATRLDEDQRRNSIWSNFRRGPGSRSVISFAPSGSMMDMHLGLSMDQHAARGGGPYETYPSASDSMVGRNAAPVEQDRARTTGVGKVKKKGIKGFLSKWMGSSSSTAMEGKKKGGSASAPTTPRHARPGQEQEEEDDYDLAPPPPLSALANERRYHSRNRSSSSFDSVGQSGGATASHSQPPASHPTPFGQHPRAASAPAPVMAPPPPQLHHQQSYGSQYLNPNANTNVNAPMSPPTPQFPSDFSLPLGTPASDRSPMRPSIITNGSSYRTAPVSLSRGPSFDAYGGEPTSPSPTNGGPTKDYYAARMNHYYQLPPPTTIPSATPAMAQFERKQQQQQQVEKSAKEKSLPSLPPMEDDPFESHSPQYAAYPSYPRPPQLPPLSRHSHRDLHAEEDEGSEEVGGGTRSRAKNKVWSMHWGGGSGGGSGANGAGRRKRTDEGDEGGETVVRSDVLEGISRDEGGLVSVRF